MLLRSKRTARTRRRPLGERTGGRIVGMVSKGDRPKALGDRRVPGSWEGDLIIGRGCESAAATLVERTSRFVILLALTAGKDAVGVAEILVETVNDLPRHIRGGLTWDQGSEMDRHAQLTVATDMPVYFAHPRSPWERPTSENTNTAPQHPHIHTPAHRQPRCYDDLTPPGALTTDTALVGRVVLLGAGFSRAVSSAMPTLATLGPLVVEALGGAGADDLAQFGGNVEEYLSHIGTDQPWLSDEDNLRNRAQFSSVVLAIRDVIARAESEAAKELPEWLGRAAWQWSQERAAVLTFNYDTLLERALAMHSGTRSVVDLYMVPLVGRMPAESGMFLSGSGPDGPIPEVFKMHGSVNWLHGGDLAPVTDPLVLDERGRLNTDGAPRYERIYADLRPFIVPPTSVKNRYYDRTGLRAQWKTAAERLRAAEQLTVVGYSLPATDVGSTAFLRTNLNPTADVTVVDLSWAVSERFRNLFPNGVAWKSGVREWLPGAVSDLVEWWVTDEDTDRAMAHLCVNGHPHDADMPDIRTHRALEEWRKHAIPELVDVQINLPHRGGLIGRGRRPVNTPRRPANP